MFAAEVTEVFIAMLKNAGFFSQGTITSCDSPFALLHGFVSSEEVLGQRVTDLIPSVQLPPPGEPVPQVGPRGPLTTTPRRCAWGPVATDVCSFGARWVLRPVILAAGVCVHSGPGPLTAVWAPKP